MPAVCRYRPPPPPPGLCPVVLVSRPSDRNAVSACMTPGAIDSCGPFYHGKPCWHCGGQDGLQALHCRSEPEQVVACPRILQSQMSVHRPTEVLRVLQTQWDVFMDQLQPISTRMPWMVLEASLPNITATSNITRGCCLSTLDVALWRFPCTCAAQVANASASTRRATTNATSITQATGVHKASWKFVACSRPGRLAKLRASFNWIFSWRVPDRSLPLQCRWGFIPACRYNNDTYAGAGTTAEPNTLFLACNMKDNRRIRC